MAQFQMGYRGYVQLGLRSSQYSRMNAQAINREVFKGWDVVGEPILDWDQYDPDKEVWGYFFGYQLVNGFTKTAVWTKEKVAVHAKRYSQSYRSGAKIWTEQFDGMALKTVVANTLRKWGPLSIQMQQAFQADQAVMRDVDAIPEYVDGNEAEALAEKPILEHPEQKKQREASEAAATKAAPREKEKATKTAPPVEKKPEPPTITVAPTPTSPPEDEKVESAMGLAPEEPKPENVVAMPEPTPEAPPVEQPKEPAPAPAPLKAGQSQLKNAVEVAGYTFEDLISTLAGKVAGFPKKTDPKCPKDWGQIEETKAQFCYKSIKGLLAAIKNYKEKGGK